MASSLRTADRRFAAGLAALLIAAGLVVPTACSSLEQARGCAELVINVGRFTVQALGSEQDQANAQKTLDEISADAPPEVRTDLDYLRQQLQAIQEAPDQAAREQITNSQQFTDALKRLGDYVTKKCEQG